MLRAILATAALTLASCSADPAMAAGERHHACMPYGDFKKLIADQGGKLVELTTDQRTFMAGVSVMDPQTPAGLPYGDKAGLVLEDDGSALAFFIDGSMACDDFELPKALVDMTIAIGRGDALHAGTAN